MPKHSFDSSGGASPIFRARDWSPHILGLAKGVLLAAMALCLCCPVPVLAAASPVDGASTPASLHPGCDGLSARQCLGLAIKALGGEQKLAGIHNIRLELAGNRLLPEQSYRQAPFITAYSRTTLTLDFRKQRLLAKDQSTWPEADLGVASANFNSTLVASPQAAVIQVGKKERPGSLANINDARVMLSLSPLRLLLTAAKAPDLHYAPAETVRSTPHSVVAFDWNGYTVKVLLNAFNHLPDAFEDTRPFDDFWFVWGDVHQRVYFSNWKLIEGVVYPTDRIEQRNGMLWRSSQVLDAKFNVALDHNAFAMDKTAAAKSAQSKGWNRQFSDAQHVVLAPGIDLYKGAWNATIIAQKDGMLVLEAPISPTYAAGVFAKARSLHPDLPIKGVLSTSDSWPHVAGVREAVADKLPVYVLDLNLPLLERMIAAPHTLRPDDLQKRPQAPHWVVVSGKREIGHGANRVVLYPLRGASTGRQYMVYFPSHKLLYASDTLALNSPTSLYDPELMYEVVQAVERHHLDVRTVYSMHQGPEPWKKIVSLVTAAIGE